MLKTTAMIMAEALVKQFVDCMHDEEDVVLDRMSYASKTDDTETVYYCSDYFQQIEEIITIYKRIPTLIEVNFGDEIPLKDFERIFNDEFKKILQRIDSEDLSDGQRDAYNKAKDYAHVIV